MSNKPRLLIVEDEEPIRTGLIDVFVYHGYDVAWADQGPEGLREALTGRFDLILLDVMLPGMDGFEICRRIRDVDRAQPIIMLTAKTSDEDIVQGLSLGADDYVAKPFSIAQLVLRVQAVLRRSQGTSYEAEAHLRLDQNNAVDVANLRLIDGTGAPVKINGAVVAFTRKEIDVLQYLFAHKNRAVSREELLSEVWGYAKHVELETRTVDIHIAKLRRKIEVDARTPRFVETVRGAGYRLCVVVD